MTALATETAPAPAPLHGSLVGAALAALAGMCDRANSLDGVGFSGADVEAGHDLATKFIRYRSWASERQLSFAKRLCHKYRRQLARRGFDVEALAAEPFTPRAQAPEEARPVRDELVIRTVTISRQTERAYYASTGPGRSEWLPKSRVTILQQVPVRLRGSRVNCPLMVANVQVPRWLAEEKGMIVPGIPPHMLQGHEGSDALVAFEAGGVQPAPEPAPVAAPAEQVQAAAEPLVRIRAVPPAPYRYELAGTGEDDGLPLPSKAA